jgi:hypothetical protein
MGATIASGGALAPTGVTISRERIVRFGMRPFAAGVPNPLSRSLAAVPRV